MIETAIGVGVFLQPPPGAAFKLQNDTVLVCVGHPIMWPNLLIMGRQTQQL